MSTPPEWVQIAGVLTWSIALVVALFWQPRWVDRLVTRLISLMNELGSRRAWLVVVLLLQVMAAEAVLILMAAPPAHADEGSYLADLGAAGVPVSDRGKAVSSGYTVCSQLRAGESPETAASQFGWFYNAWGATIVATAQRDLCPDTLH